MDRRSLSAIFTTVLPVTLLLAVLLIPAAALAAPIHTTYLWHMHQPVYWPDESTWTPGRYETAYETITLGHSQNNVFDIFNKDDRVADYQYYPRNAIASILDLPDAGAQVSFASALIENIKSLADAGWNGGRYASDWYSDYRTARSWTTSGGRSRLAQVLVAAHHPIAPLMDENALVKEIAVAKVAHNVAWGDAAYSEGYFPAEMCFSERMIPSLVDAGVEWVIVADIHISRACADYPWNASQDNCDAPNRADQVNPAQGYYTSQSISRGVTVKTPPPYGFRPHYARFVDPDTGTESKLIVVPASNAMSWNEGYGLYGTGEIDAIASYNDPARPMLILFAHDGDNAWSGGYSYYHENVSGFSHSAASAGYEPSTIAEYLADHPIDPSDIVHVEDGGWVNADGDFGSPQFINWNWPLVDSSGNFDIPGGWAEDERNWAVLTAAQNRVETAEQIDGGSVDAAEIFDPGAGASQVERAWHHLLSGYESGYMYYGASLDMELKATLASNAAMQHCDPVIGSGTDNTPPTVWIPQRLPWNPGGRGGGSLWGYPGGAGAEMDSDFYVWTFAYDVSGLARVELKYRIDADGDNPMTSDENETYTGGPGVGAWHTLEMTRRPFPKDDFLDSPEIDFTVLPDYIADEFYIQLTGFSEVLIDYYVEAEDSMGLVKRTPIQHVWVGESTGSASHNIDGELDPESYHLASSGGIDLYADWDGRYLYVATQGVGPTTGTDNFIMIAEATSSPAASPWAKSGTVAGKDLFLGNEDSNNWNGWFDSGEGLISSGVESASGAYLEGLIDLESHLGLPLPSGVYIAAAAYESPDMGSLAGQSPAGNGDGDIDAAEFYWFPFDFTDAEPISDMPAATITAAWPNPFSSAATIDYHLGSQARISLDVYDIRGRRIKGLVSGSRTAGPHRASWNGLDSRGQRVSSGLYFIRLESLGKIQTRKIVLFR